MTAPSLRSRLARVVFALTLVCVFGPLACSGGDNDLGGPAPSTEPEPLVVDWDLTASRSSRAVGWKGTEDSFYIDNVSHLRVRLPNGLVIEEQDVDGVGVGRQQGQVCGFSLGFPAETAEAAHRRGKAMAERYRLDHNVETFDQFLQVVQRRRAAGQKEWALEEFVASFGAIASNMPYRKGTPEEPNIRVLVIHTESAERPWYVELIVEFTPQE